MFNWTKSFCARVGPRNRSSAVRVLRALPSFETLEERRVLSTANPFSILPTRLESVGPTNSAPTATIANLTKPSVSSNGPSLTGLLPTISYSAVPFLPVLAPNVFSASQFVVAVPTSASAGSAFNVTIIAENWLGQFSTNYNATPTITASDGQPVTLTHMVWSGGVGTATVVLNEPDSVALTVTASGGAFGKVSSAIAVTAQTRNDSVWSGYAALPGAGTVTAVGGTWVEPTVTGPGNTSIWVGIDGYANNTVEQLGVATSQVNGVTVYTPWIEFWGDQSTTGTKGPDYHQTNLPASFVVRPGDIISASVSLVPGTTRTFQFQMRDIPKNGGAVENYSSQQSMTYVTPLRSTVDWIVENNNNGAQPFANFVQVAFTGAWATVSGVTGGINSQKNLLALNLLSTQGKDVTSNPPTLSRFLGYNEPSTGTGTSSFSINWTGGPLLINIHLLPPSLLNGAAGVIDAIDAFFAGDFLFSRDPFENPFAI
jgi:Peptidase A4 family